MGRGCHAEPPAITRCPPHSGCLRFHAGGVAFHDGPWLSRRAAGHNQVSTTFWVSAISFSRSKSGCLRFCTMGVILYELLAGTRPFRGTPPQLLRSIRCREPIPPRWHNRRVPRPLEAICLKAMARRAGDRFASAQELAEECERFVEGHPTVTRPASRLRMFCRWSLNRLTAPLAPFNRKPRAPIGRPPITSIDVGPIGAAGCAIDQPYSIAENLSGVGHQGVTPKAGRSKAY